MSMDKAEQLLSVQNLSVRFQSSDRVFEAIKGISFEVAKGEVVGLVGESGSGKSLTALSINQLIRSIPNARQEGEIIFEKDQNLTRAGSQQLQKIRGKSISMIFQEPMSSLNPVMSCGRQIAEVLQIHQKVRKRKRKSQVLELLEQVQLKDVERIYRAFPNEISGGQKQRVMIAMAMACRPKLLIADEPTTALDVTIQRSIIELMKQLQGQTGMSILFISHDLNLVSEIADRVMVMRQGQIVEQGSVKDIFSQPRQAYTMGLLACRPPLNLKMSRLPLIADFEATDPNVKPDLQEVLDRLTLDTLPEKEEGQTLLKVGDLRVWFPRRKGWLNVKKEFVKAVDGVSFELKKGEILGLVGESGSGKTTLGRSLLRLVEPTGGQVFFDGQDVVKQLRRRIQIIFQDPYASLNPRMSIGQAIMEPLWVHRYIRSSKEGEDEVYRLLRLVGLEEEHFNRYPNEFSGGQRQRIGIARALAARPELLICDESVASLDVSIQAQILNLLKDLNKQYELSILFIAHDLAVIKYLCDRMLVMKDGIFVEWGKTDDIYKNATQEYTKKLISAIPKSVF